MPPQYIHDILPGMLTHHIRQKVEYNATALNSYTDRSLRGK